MLSAKADLRGQAPLGGAKIRHGGPRDCMPRRPREEVEGGIFHVYARGNDRRNIFLDDLDRQRYLSLLGRSVRQRRWNALAYCLMSNHLHLLIETPERNLAVGMHRIQSPYAHTFNKRHHRTGHLFESRYGAVRVETNEQLLIVLRYIARNPVAAGVVADPATWRWSSHRAMVGLARPPSWLASDRLRTLLAGWSGGAGGAYEELVYGPKGACPL